MIIILLLVWLLAIGIAIALLKASQY